MRYVYVVLCLCAIALPGCSITGDHVGPCTMYQDTSLNAGVALADCKVAPGHELVTGEDPGILPTVGEFATGAGMAGGAALLAPAIPKTLTVKP